jgi:uncharacterized HhH-GPD family protein
VRHTPGVPQLCIAQDAAADELLGRDPLALLLGMMLDQQFAMERAFAGPRLLADRLGVDTLSAADLAEADPEQLAKVFQGPPALHRYPGSMAPGAPRRCAGCSWSATAAAPSGCGPTSPTAPPC